MTLINACCGESMAAKLDQLTALVQSMDVNPRDPHSDIIITAIICGTLIVIAWVGMSLLRKMRKDTMLHEKEMESEKRAWEEKAIERETLEANDKKKQNALEAYRQKKLAILEKGTTPDDPYIMELEKYIERLEEELKN